MTKIHEPIYSEPDSKSGAVHLGNMAIDFSMAVKFDTTGTTCDAYRVRVGNTLFFVKKLKEKWAYSPIYRDALQKEYEIGSALEHECLPIYRYAVENYIVLNYIDGDTLARLIADNDKWLFSDKNIIAVLRKLLDVLDYLHKKGIIHCDVKTDNVMITHSNHNVKLIDLDKCYTDSRIFSPGSAKLYDVEKPGTPQIDFNGLSKIAQSLSKFASPGCKKHIERFVKACQCENASIENLEDILSDKKRNYVPLWLTGIIFLAAVGFLIVEYSVDEPKGAAAVQTEDAIQKQAEDTREVEAQDYNERTQQIKELPIQPPEASELKNAVESKSNPVADTVAINNMLKTIYKPFYDRLSLYDNINIEDLSRKEFLDIITDVNDLQQEVWDAGFAKFREHFSELEYGAAYEKYVKYPAFQEMIGRMKEFNDCLTPLIQRQNPD